MTNAEISEATRKIVADALGRGDDEVKLASILMTDLGAESLDFLDIVFRLEREFDIQITRGEMERASRGDLTQDEFAPGGVISEAESVTRTASRRKRVSACSVSPGDTPQPRGFMTPASTPRARAARASAAVTTVLPTPVSVPVTNRPLAMPGMEVSASRPWPCPRR